MAWHGFPGRQTVPRAECAAFTTLVADAPRLKAAVVDATYVTNGARHQAEGRKSFLVGTDADSSADGTRRRRFAQWALRRACGDMLQSCGLS